MTEHLIGQLGYVGITLILILGGLGLPIPEEAPIILAAVLSRNGQMRVPFALVSCLTGVLLGDLVVYFLGFFYGEKVLSLPLTRRLLTRQREAQIKGYFHRHGFKILVSGRFVPGFRTAAYLTAGILKLPMVKLVVTDVVAASLSTVLLFGLGYAFAHQIQNGIREVQQGVIVIGTVGLAMWLLIRYIEARRRSGLPVGPPVLDSDDVPLPAADHAVAPLAPVPVPGREMATPEVASGPPEPGTIDPGARDQPGRCDTEAKAAAAPRAFRAHEPIGIELDPGDPPSAIESATRRSVMESPVRRDA